MIVCHNTTTFQDKINFKMITHFNFKVNFSCLIRNHLQSNLLRRNLNNSSQRAISVDFVTWYNNIVIMFGFFNFVFAFVAVVFYTSNGQPLQKEQDKLESKSGTFNSHCLMLNLVGKKTISKFAVVKLVGFGEDLFGLLGN